MHVCVCVCVHAIFFLFHPHVTFLPYTSCICVSISVMPVPVLLCRHILFLYCGRLFSFVLVLLALICLLYKKLYPHIISVVNVIWHVLT